jgi:membrane associated rhomboid family serine protease
MVPIGDFNPSSRTPYVVYLLLATNILAFLYEIVHPDLNQFFNQWAVIPAKVTPALSAVFSGQIGAWPYLVPMFTAMFLHGGFLHLGGNMLFLWIFGDNVEDRLGHLGFLIFYLTCGLVATLVQIWGNPSSQIPNLGASGAIAGVLGAYIVRFPSAKIQAIFPLGFIPIPFSVPAIAFIGFWFVQQAFYSLASLGPRTQTGMESGGVAYLAHAGGFIIGALLIWLFDRGPQYRY